MPIELAFDLPGDWTSSWILVRLLMAVRSPWLPDEQGFAHQETGERVRLFMGPAAEGLSGVVADGICPVRPTVDDALLAQIAGHKTIVRVALDPGEIGPRPALRLLRAANAVVNGGALAVRCATSGLVHGADAVAAYLERAEEAASADDVTLARALYEVYVLVSPSAGRTFGMHALGAPDVRLRHRGEDLEHGVVALEDRALALLGDTDVPTFPDPLSKADPRHNPRGLTWLDVDPARANVTRAGPRPDRTPR